MVFLPLDFIFPVCRENGMVVNHCHLVINDRSFSVIKVFRFFEISKHSSVKIAYTRKGGLWGQNLYFVKEKSSFFEKV